MNNKTTKKALMMSVISMLLTMTMLVGTTYAWFTDSVASGKNTIVAGNLDVELSYWTNGDWETVEGKSDLFDPKAIWEPGHTEVVYLKVSNEGDLAVKYLLALTIFEEINGMTKDSKDIKLSDHLMFGIVEDAEADKFDDRKDAIAAVTNPMTLSSAVENGKNTIGGTMEKGAPDKLVALVVWMPTDVSNEANHDGVHVPKVELGVSLIATQHTVEKDAFDETYDKDAGLVGMATVKVDKTADINVMAFDVRNASGSKVAHVNLPVAAVDGEDFSISIEETAVDPNVTVNSDQEAQTFEITTEGLVANNDREITIWLRVGAGLTNVQLYHNDKPITSTVNGEYVIFKTTSFSPFTVVYDAVAVEGPDPDAPSDLPKAKIELAPQFIGTSLDWKSFGGISPDFTVDPDPKLEAAYVFAITETSEEANKGPYGDWYCDFYVKLDRDLGANQILLAGNYGEFGWVGFHNGTETLPANTEVPLLGYMGGSNWTYGNVAELVNTFACGVGDVKDQLAGATFTVMLRLTNPENTDEFYNVATVNYVFEKSADHVVDSAAALTDALAQGGTIALSKDIEVTEKIEIPAGVTATIDLDGHTITAGYQAGSTEKHLYAFDNSGNLTIEGGVINARGIYNQDGATLTVNGTTINAIDYNGGACIWGYGSTSKVYVNNAILTGYTGVISSEGYVEINGGTYTCYSGMDAEGKQYTSPTYNVRAYNGLKITDGTFTSRHGVISLGGGEAVIEGGNYTIQFAAATTSNVVYVYGNADLTINGGSFTSDNTSGKADSGAAVLVDSNTAKITINDGTFVGMNGMVSGKENANIVLNGGSYSTVFDYNHYGAIEPFVAPGKTVTVNGTAYPKAAG